MVTQQALLPPSPLRFVLCIFITMRFQLFLPSSTRVELCLPTLSWALSAVDPSLSYFCFKKIKASPLRDSNSRINTINSINSSIRGLPPLIHHRGDRLRMCNTTNDNCCFRGYIQLLILLMLIACFLFSSFAPFCSVCRPLPPLKMAQPTFRRRNAWNYVELKSETF